MESSEHVLSERKKQILKAIVDAHIVGGEPIGSKVLMQQITCSSATIRNEMAELEEMGYLEQPHTSAGRVPSELGYRFYVDSLVEHYAMTAREVAQINQALRSKMNELDQILATASALASNLTNYTGFALKPRSQEVTVSKYEAIYVGPGQFVLVMITDSGSVKTKNVKLEMNFDSASVARLSTTLNEHLTGKRISEITLPTIVAMEEAMAEDAGMVSPVMKLVYEMMNQADDGELKVSGVDRLLQYPEFNDTEQLKGLLGALEQKNDLMEMISDAAERQDHGALIGSEATVKEMNNSTVVFKTVVKDGKSIGAIGVIGPLRMDYARVMAALDELTENVANVLSDSAPQLGNGGNHKEGDPIDEETTQDKEKTSDGREREGQNG